MLAKDFKALINTIDKDFSDIEASSFPRNRLYYHITIDGRVCDLITRKIKTKFSTSFNFLVARPHMKGSPTSSMLYLSDIDIIEMLSCLDDKKFNHITDFLIKCSLGRISLNHFIQLERTAIHENVKPFHVSTKYGLALIGSKDDKSTIQTPQGIPISARTFYDLISLALSKENMEKMKATATKYVTLSSILSSRNTGIPRPKELSTVTNIASVRSLYGNKGTNAQRRFDIAVFSKELYQRYFENLLSSGKL